MLILYKMEEKGYYIISEEIHKEIFVTGNDMYDF